MERNFTVRPIIVEPRNLLSVEVRENSKVILNMQNDMPTLLRLLEKESKIQKLIKNMCEKKKYPTVLQKLIDFRKEHSPDGETENDLELKDFFKVSKRVLILLNQNFHIETIIRMMLCASLRPGCFMKSDFNRKFLAAFVDENVRKKFWGTKSLTTILIVRKLLEDLNRGISMEKFTKTNLKKSGLVIHFLPEDKKLEHFLTFSKN